MDPGGHHDGHLSGGRRRGGGIGAADRAGATDPARDDDDDGDGGIIDNDGGSPHELSWWENRVLEITRTLGRDLEEFPENPSQAISQLQSDIPALVADEVGHALEAYQAFPLQFDALAVAPLANVGFLGGGFAALTGLTGIQPAAAAPTVAAPMPETPTLPVATSSPVVSTASAPGSAPASAPASTPASAPAATATAGAPPPPASGPAGPVFPYLIGGPTMGASSGMSTSAQRKAPDPDIVATPAAAAASAREKETARRRSRAGLRNHHRGYRYEFLDADSDIDAQPDGFRDRDGWATSAVASNQGAGNLGFAGTARKDEVIEAAGLATLAGDGFGGGPSVPMVPGTWEPDPFANENHIQ